MIEPSILYSESEEAGAMPPKRTLERERFIATHIMYDSMEPLVPINAPTVVSRGLSNIKPSATSAKPEYAFSTVMTTGISAPPIAAVVVYPFRKLRMALPVRHAAAIAGDPGARARNVPIVAMLAPRRELFRKCLGPGIRIGLEDMRPASLRKATMEPVKVTPPIRTPRYPATRCSVETSPPICAITLPMLVRTAAKPTTECRAATVCGRSVAVVRRPIKRPCLSVPNF